MDSALSRSRNTRSLLARAVCITLYFSANSRMGRKKRPVSWMNAKSSAKSTTPTANFTPAYQMIAARVAEVMNSTTGKNTA